MTTMMSTWCGDSDDRGFVGVPPPDQLLIPLGRRISHTKKMDLVSKMRCEIREDRRRKPRLIVSDADDDINRNKISYPAATTARKSTGEPLSLSTEDIFREAHGRMGEAPLASAALRKKREAERQSLRRMEEEAASASAHELTTEDLNLISFWGIQVHGSNHLLAVPLQEDGFDDLAFT